jgi:hypothetical protein
MHCCRYSHCAVRNGVGTNLFRCLYRLYLFSSVNNETSYEGRCWIQFVIILWVGKRSRLSIRLKSRKSPWKHQRCLFKGKRAFLYGTMPYVRGVGKWKAAKPNFDQNWTTWVCWVGLLQPYPRTKYEYYWMFFFRFIRALLSSCELCLSSIFIA